MGGRDCALPCLLSRFERVVTSNMHLPETFSGTFSSVPVRLICRRDLLLMSVSSSWDVVEAVWWFKMWQGSTEKG